MLKQGEQYSAEDFIALKNKVKAEMLRRCYVGDLSSYGGSDYDFAVQPQAGGQIMAEQANKIIEPMNAINDSGFILQNGGDPAMAMDQLNAKIAVYESASLSATDHFCKASCAGLCYTECSDTCTGDCTGSCGESCSTNCSTTCTGTCSGTCSTSCTGTCVSGCAWHCTNTCGGSGCTGSCTGNCTNSCSGSTSGTGGGFPDN